MPVPFVIDNQEYRLRDALNELLAQSAGKPVDIASAYFAISGYRLREARLCRLLCRQLELEKKLAAVVEDAYGLTPEERALMRSTRPVRDPIDVLEAKIRGESGVDSDSAAERGAS